MTKKINITYATLLVVFLSALLVSSCSKKSHTFSLAFYNVENLFDTIDDQHKNDNRYLPDSKIPWNTERYYHKLENISKVIAAMDSVELPSVIGLAEVENKAVLQDLVSQPNIAGAHYQILHKESADERGIDVALLYRPDKYTPVETNYIKLVFPLDPTYNTRDILYSKGLANNKDTVHIFINHWTSRYGGQEETIPYRKYTAQILKKYTDSLFNINPHVNILIAGDLNDNPDDESVAKDLGAIEPVQPYKNDKLYNLSIKQYKMGSGSLYYHGWDMFDQIIVSTPVLTGENGLQAVSRDQTIVKKDWMLYFPERGEPRPNRTAAGRYYGGYSDHLPVLLKMNLIR